MGSILIRNIPDALHDQLRAVAKQQGTSVEALARQALERAVPAVGAGTLGDAEVLRKSLGIPDVTAEHMVGFDDPAWGKAIFGIDEPPTEVAA